MQIGISRLDQPIFRLGFREERGEALAEMMEPVVTGGTSCNFDQRFPRVFLKRKNEA